MPETDGMGPILDELSVIRTGIAELCTAMAREQERAAFREDIIDRLHSENQSLRRSEVEATLEPVRAGLYRLYDLAQREAARWQMAGDRDNVPSEAAPNPPDGPLFGVFAEQVGALFGAFAAEISEVLGRTGVEPFDVDAGDRYDPALHRPVDTVHVDHVSWDGAVVEAVSTGFRRGEQVLRRADVVVGRTADQ